MNSLNLRFQDEVFTPYLDLLKAEYRFHPTFSQAKQKWEEKLTARELINGPYLEKSHTYASGGPIESLPLHEKTKATIHKRLDKRGLWKHQTEALNLLLAGENVVIATGTSSGKTLCYQIPILDDLIRDPSSGLRAIIIYPLNALVNDQLKEWEGILKEHNQITFARFTGQTPRSQSDYQERLKDTIRQQLIDQGLKQYELQREIEVRLREHLQKEIPNCLNHRDDIRANPPHVLITNFSMLEYLLVRPVDAPIFEKSRLKFLVLDEAHAYRGVQATEIAFLIRRLKDRLHPKKLICIATSATLGKEDDPDSRSKVRQFAGALFDDSFIDQNPIYGTPDTPQLKEPVFCPTPTQYLKAAETLRPKLQADVTQQLGIDLPKAPLAALLEHDKNLYRLRKEILTKPKLLSEAAHELWPDDPKAEDGLQALLEIAAAAKTDESHEDLLPTRLHYFIRAQDGLHICLHKQCPGRQDGQPAFFISRKSGPNTPEGYCPDCYGLGLISLLVEVVTCRKCGYLFGTLQDMGPRRAQNPENDDDANKPYFDSFSTELGWAGDSFWSYFSVEDELPYPSQPKDEEDEEDQHNLLLNPAELEWCVICGKKNDQGSGDNCHCTNPHLRTIKVFHRQCPHSGRTKDRENLYHSEKKPLTSCPNCGARNSSGLEPVRRFQESDDEIGLAMAIPLAHFQVSHRKVAGKPPRKLLCFTDHRQSAAAFPSLLEEETFSHDLGRKIVKIVYRERNPLDLVSLGEYLAEIADLQSDNYDPDFFLPVSRFPDEDLDAKGKRNLWIAETLSYFGIPDSARESAEDLGLVAIEYQLKDREEESFHALLNAPSLTLSESTSALQILLGFIRKRKAFTLPNGVDPDSPAFGRVTADISYVLRREGNKNTIGWLPRLNKDNKYQDNFITDYLRRLLGLPSDKILSLAEKIWNFLTSEYLLYERKGTCKLDHERLLAVKPVERYVCSRCGLVTSYSARFCCPRKGCDGNLELRPFESDRENIIAKWVAGTGEFQFTTLKSEEHTAQIAKPLAAAIEDEFRAEGVNLLSSTTTFEMGINIGDLQKVLLRNAPPTSANYVQRVGRAGRGQDKNSVCVTLCRRTKYDGDAWKEPPRLMSGEVRTPTVFLQNKVISQRHFNAAALARFLRIKIADERKLGNVIRQQIPQEAFLPLDSRSNIPEAWFQVRPTDLFLDFEGWLVQQKEKDIFQTQSGRSLLGVISGFKAATDFDNTAFDTAFDTAKAETIDKYKKVLAEITEELSALKRERKNLFDQGGNTVDIERAIKNLLSHDIIAILAKRGFLPRYAFPLDVVTLETEKNRWSPKIEIELSRDRGIAIAEFAPGAQVIAHKKVFTSAGLYIVSSTDKPDRYWYSECPSCKQIRTSRTTQDPLLRPCEVCQQPITTQRIKPFVEPLAFSVRIDKKSDGSARYRRSTLIRQRQTITHFIDSIDEANFKEAGLFLLALKEEGKLFRYNLGPQRGGFMLCPSCGCSEPLRDFKAGQKHKRLRSFSGNVDCVNDHPWTKPLAYGHEFPSFCLIARPIAPFSVIDPLAFVSSLAFALQRGLCNTLDIETTDIGVSWRWLEKRSTATGRAEIILYDHTPGGAGFVKEGYENWAKVIQEAFRICNDCTCGDTEIFSQTACYDCLKNYGNQSHHEKLNRLSVIEFLKGEGESG